MRDIKTADDLCRELLRSESIIAARAEYDSLPQAVIEALDNLERGRIIEECLIAGRYVWRITDRAALQALNEGGTTPAVGPCPPDVTPRRAIQGDDPLAAA